MPAAWGHLFPLSHPLRYATEYCEVSLSVTVRLTGVYTYIIVVRRQPDS